jgi:hydroxymethylpyrimidine pyrophosphatase-like HAD family hydrolase
MAERRNISLVLADVDGTLVTEQKVLTKQTQNAVTALQGAGMRFALTSGRPTLVMAMLFEPLELDTPIAGFNQDECSRVAREAWTVKFEPKIVADVAEHLQQIAKIVGVSDDLNKVQRCEADAQAAFARRSTANRSQPYYLDVTNKDANKGSVVEYLSRQLGVPEQEIATIGDQPNDVLVFQRSGFSIATGNAFHKAKVQANVVTDSYNDEGFAKAMEAFILGSAR